ncbi:MAG: DUF3343 domain-containing protein [Spirochaetota bacterium]
MISSQSYYVVLFKSVSHAMRAERILKNEKIPFKIIPVPKSISSDCGVCIRFIPEYRETIEAILKSTVEYSDIRELN